jgi:RHS repeat-associated protein
VSVYAAVSTHVIIDVVGYVTGPSSPVSQAGLFRLFESPVSVGSQLAVPTTTAGTGFDVAGRGGVDSDALGVALLAVVSNRTATTANVAVVADGTTFPGVSSLNPAPGERTAVAVTSGLSAGRVRVVSSQVVDVELFVVGVYVSSITPTLTPASGVGPSGLVFDPLGRLASTTAGGVTVEYSYLADGTRVAARTQGGAQVYYLGGIEATRTTGGVWSQVRRTYPYGGVTVASRTTTPGGTGVSWLLGDRQGSITTTVTAGIPSTRWYLPYGGRRGPTPGSVPTTTGFLGQHEDGSGLTHLEHRDYDPTTGVFITVDPLVASTGDPYSYAAGNPTTLSDPNGLEPGCGNTAYSATSCGQAHASATAAWWTAASAAYEVAAGGDGSDLSTVAAELGLAPGAGLPGALWRELADIGWSYFQRLNFFYWQHRLVQVDIARQVPGSEIEFGCASGSGMRADVCRPGSGEYAEIKPLGRDLEGADQLDRFLRQLRANHGFNPDDPSFYYAASGGDWPSAGQIGVPGTPISVSYSASAFAGVYTWNYTGGGLPTWADWKVTQREAVKSHAASLVGATSPGFNWNAPNIDPGRVGPTIGVGGLLIACLFFCVPTPWPVL